MKRLLRAGLLLAPAFGQAPRADWNLRDHIPLEEVVVQSHRGAGVLSPENSLEAFEIAWRLGTIPEADLRTTRDGVIVAFHDNDFQRILPGAPAEARQRGIRDLTWDEVRRLDIGAWKGKQFARQRVPRMSQMFAVLNRHAGRRLYIDVKNVNLEPLAREAHAAGVAGRLILASPDHSVIREWKRLAPASSTLHWMGGSEDQLAGRLAALRKTGFAAITQLQIHVRLQQETLTPLPRFLMDAGKELRGRGILFQVLPWQSSDRKLFWKLMDLGVASFATDYPDAAMAAIRDYYAQPRR